MLNVNGMDMFYLACCGPTFPGSCALLAVIWKSAIAPDSIPNAALQVAVNEKRKKKIQIKILFTVQKKWLGVMRNGQVGCRSHMANM